MIALALALDRKKLAAFSAFGGIAGADVVATTSALLRHGPQHMTALVDGLERWLSQNAFASVTEIRGRLDGTHVERADTFLRTQYLRALSDYALHHPSDGASLLMKGSLHSDKLLAECTHKESGLRTGRRISHVFIMDVQPAWLRFRVHLCGVGRLMTWCFPGASLNLAKGKARRISSRNGQYRSKV